MPDPASRAESITAPSGVLINFGKASRFRPGPVRTKSAGTLASPGSELGSGASMVIPIMSRPHGVDRLDLIARRQRRPNHKPRFRSHKVLPSPRLQLRNRSGSPNAVGARAFEGPYLVETSHSIGVHGLISVDIITYPQWSRLRAQADAVKGQANRPIGARPGLGT